MGGCVISAFIIKSKFSVLLVLGASAAQEIKKVVPSTFLFFIFIMFSKKTTGFGTMGWLALA